MSIVNTTQYKAIADLLGTAYGLLRDAYFQDGAGASNAAYKNVKDAFDTYIAAADDSTIFGSGAAGVGESTDPTNSNYSAWIASGKQTAPPGSIGSDLNSTWSSLINTSLSLTQAKKKASSALSSALNSLNSHIIKRTYGISTISTYYSTYSSELFVSSYFSADFAELSSELGKTIDSQWITP